jgi:hypothetical protein
VGDREETKPLRLGKGTTFATLPADESSLPPESYSKKGTESPTKSSGSPSTPKVEPSGLSSALAIEPWVTVHSEG